MESDARAGAYVPPLLFAVVADGVYRGCYPKPQSLPFLQRLGLRTVLSITPEPLPGDQLAVLGPDLQYVHIAGEEEQAKSKKKKDVPVTMETVRSALDVLLEPANRPVFVHCLNGKQATSLVVACFRVVNGWSLRSVLSELSRYTDHARSDVVFLQAFAAELPEDQRVDRAVRALASVQAAYENAQHA